MKKYLCILLNMYAVCLLCVMVTLVQIQGKGHVLFERKKQNYCDAYFNCNGGSLATYADVSSVKTCIPGDVKGEIWIRGSEELCNNGGDVDNKGQGQQMNRKKMCTSVNVNSERQSERKCDQKLPHICVVESSPVESKNVIACPLPTTLSLSPSIKTTTPTAVASSSVTAARVTSPTVSKTTTENEEETTTRQRKGTVGDEASSSAKPQDYSVIIGITLTCVFLAVVIGVLAILALKRRDKLQGLKIFFHNQNCAKTDENILIATNENCKYFCLEKSVYAQIADPIGAVEKTKHPNQIPQNKISEENTGTQEDRMYDHLRENNRHTDPSSLYSTQTFEMSPGEYAHTSEISPVTTQIMNDDEYTHIDVGSNGK